MVTQIVTLCDVCYDEGTSTTATQHRVAVAGGTWSLELCPEHYDALVAPLADVAERLGEAVKAPKADAKGTNPKANRRMSEPCLICGEHVAVASSLVTHYKARHGLAGMAGAYGLVCPLCGHEGGSSTSIASHVGRAHHEVAEVEGGSGMAEAFRYASEHGDPHDVVAKQLAALGLAAMPDRIKP